MSEQTKIKRSPAVEGKKHHKVRWIVLAVLLVIVFGFVRSIYTELIFRV